jgi:hypothetical protein
MGCSNSAVVVLGEDPDAKKDVHAEITFERDKELLSVSITEFHCLTVLNLEIFITASMWWAPRTV